MGISHTGIMQTSAMQWEGVGISERPVIARKCGLSRNLLRVSVNWCRLKGLELGLQCLGGRNLLNQFNGEYWRAGLLLLDTRQKGRSYNLS